MLDSLFEFERISDSLDPQADPYATQPVAWVQNRLSEHVWSKQVDVLESVVEHRYTAVMSAHSTGKSHIAARAIGWWVDTHPADDVFIVSTAPSAPQVRAILWRYLKQVHRKAGLAGHITGGEIPEWKLPGDILVGWGRKPADLSNAEEAATSFQGIHARYVLVVLDEAGGIPEWLWNAVDTLVTSPTNRVLAIGNPDDPTSHFEKVCRPGSGWNVIQISAYDTPAWTGEDVPDELLDVLVSPEWVTERKRSWGEDSPLFISKVLAEFPEVTDDNLIPIAWIRRAILEDLSGEAIADLGQFGMDVARSGKAETVIYRHRGGEVRLTWVRRGLGDTMKAVAHAAEIMRGAGRGVPMVIDADGLGAGVFDRMAELNLPVAPFHGGRRAFRPKKFRNRRSEQFWALRKLFEDELIDLDPEDEDLHSQLASIKWFQDSAGRTYIETKDDMAKRGLPSPDRADAVMMVFAPSEDWAGSWKLPEGLSKPRAETITGDLLDKVML